MTRKLLTLIVLCAVVVIGGCARPVTEREFLAADIELTTAYLVRAHPAAMAWARANNPQLAVNLHWLAKGIQGNTAHKTRMLGEDYERISTIRAGIGLMYEILDVAVPDPEGGPQ